MAKDPPEPRIVGLDHVQITVPRGAEAAARRFYCELLGLPEIPKPAALQARGGLWLQAGDRQIHIGTEEGADRHATKAHVAYRVLGLEAWRRRLTQEGIRVEEAIPLPGCRRFEFRDPFGNRVEMVEREG
jgi:catechol 2,3-dioxygenase-like lactoylglutathione lyase family enzyme